jgi:hypothetical protein
LAGALEHRELLRAPDGGGGQILVDAGPEQHLVRLQVLAGAPQGLVQRAQGRAAVAGHIAGGVQTGRLVTHTLLHQQARQGLCGGHQHPPVGLHVFVVEADRQQAHARLRVGLITAWGNTEAFGVFEPSESCHRKTVGTRLRRAIIAQQGCACISVFQVAGTGKFRMDFKRFPGRSGKRTAGPPAVPTCRQRRLDSRRSFQSEPGRTWRSDP